MEMRIRILSIPTLAVRRKDILIERIKSPLLKGDRKAVLFSGAKESFPLHGEGRKKDFR